MGAVTPAPSPQLPLEELARKLGRQHQFSLKPGAKGNPRAHIRRVRKAYRAAYRELAVHVGPAWPGEPVEWLLDNNYLIEEAFDQVEVDLPRSFFRELPRLATDPEHVPRAYTVAQALVESGDGHVDLSEAESFLTAYQSASPLDIGELWAFPALLRLVLLEALTRTVCSLTAVERSEPVMLDRSWDARLPPPSPESVGGHVASLRAAAAHDWMAFFESLNRVDRVFRLDPTRIYERMDFDTRNRYRNQVERISRRTGIAEQAVAQETVRLAREASPEDHPTQDQRQAHVGYFLQGPGLSRLEQSLGYRPSLIVRLRRWPGTHPHVSYLGSVGLLSVALLSLVWLWMDNAAATPVQMWFALVLSVVPAVSFAVPVVNWIVTHVVPPAVLPKMDFSDEIPAPFRTVVVIPSLLAGLHEVDTLLEHLEMNFQSARHANLFFALLTDFSDAADRDQPGEDAVLTRTRSGVRELNDRYGSESSRPFLLLHRERTWNEGEQCWMGWERKRGKLAELNRLLLGDDHGLTVMEGDQSLLEGTRFVITLDADSFLPQGAAHRLIGTLAHPLNRPSFDEEGRVAEGYTVLQPRIDILPGVGSRTQFARIFHGDRGLDLYSRSVSDVYQDLFGEGIFAGKGIYDVAAFVRSLEDRIPENALLSHDLFEGVHGRAALVSDVPVFEDYPDHLLTYSKRLHRWVRGDWQLLPWLWPATPSASGPRIRNRLGVLALWKIADNLRRSLLSPTLVALLLCSWLFLPGPVWAWTLAVVFLVGVPILLSAAGAAHSRIRFPGRRARFQAVKRFPPIELTRWLLVTLFLPSFAALDLDAILRTIYRLRVSRRHLLEWTSAAHTAQAVRGLGAWELVRSMSVSPLFAVAAGASMSAFRVEALPLALPLLAGWLAAPWVAHRISRPMPEDREELRPADEVRLRKLTRRTWAFYERFVGPTDNWLPPDNFQEAPGAKVAHRTSPTNIGLWLVSALGAYDVGYVSGRELTATLANTFDALARLETYRGHLLNWYDTQSGAPLPPAYVSTVDSGNLAAGLIVLSGGLDDVFEASLPRQEELTGLGDALMVLGDHLDEWGSARGAEYVAASSTLAAIQSVVSSSPASSAGWLDAVLGIEHGWLPELEANLAQLVESAGDDVDPARIGSLRAWLQRIRDHVAQARDELFTLCPWTEWMRSTPEAIKSAPPESDVGKAWHILTEGVPERASLRESADTADRLSARLVELAAAWKRRLHQEQSAVDGEAAADPDPVGAWTFGFQSALLEAAEQARATCVELTRLRDQIESTVEAMDFRFLYDERRRLFHIGYNVSARALDTSFYDLFASEARLASYFAVARGDVDIEHWLHLGRPFARAGQSAVLMSWAGTMFEYLMPTLTLKTPERSLTALGVHAAIERQKAFARQERIPWGISESGYYHLDAHHNYQYRAFGVPDLGLKRGAGDRLVVAPYASLLALRFQPSSVVRNLEALDDLGMAGDLGFYEAIDFGGARGEDRTDPQIVRSYMAHHQGMIFTALVNHLTGDLMVARFHRNPRMAAVEYLLQEDVPGAVRIKARRADHPAPIRRGPAPLQLVAWRPPPDSLVPHAHVLSNGQMSTLVTDSGAGGIRWRGRVLTRWVGDPAREGWGNWIYVRESDTDRLWSIGRLPAGGEPDRFEVSYSPFQAIFRAGDGPISATMDVTVSPYANVEIRRISLVNDSPVPRTLEVSSFGEVSLTSVGEDRRHPAFARLFVESEFTPSPPTLLFRRRLAYADQEPIHMAHTVVPWASDGELARWCAARDAFVGRPGSFARPSALLGVRDPDLHRDGATLDPVFSLTWRLTLEPGATGRLAFLTAVGESRENALNELAAFRSPGRIDLAFGRAQTRSRAELHRRGIPPAEAATIQRIVAACVFPFHGSKERVERTEAAGPKLPLLWGVGISGDFPIVLLRANHHEEVATVQELLSIHSYLKAHGVSIDLVILDEDTSGYADPVGDWLMRALERSGERDVLNQRAGVRYLRSNQLDDASFEALLRSAALVFDTSNGSVASQIPTLGTPPARLPPFVPVPTTPLSDEPTPPLSRPDLMFDNGHGGFSPDGSEYVIYLEPGHATPAPWINVIANPEFGFTISESGAGTTWAGNSGENRLTTWSNDPVLDTPAEVVYLRDEETGEFWSPTPSPAPAGAPYEVRHGAGYTRFRHHSHGLEQSLELYASIDKPLKFARLELLNTWDRPRRITVTYFAEWVLGSIRRITAAHVITQLDAEAQALMAWNEWTPTLGPGVAFLASSEPVHGATSDRAEFMGPDGSLSRPAALGRIGLAQGHGSGRDPCGALQIHLDLSPGERRVAHFLVGASEDLEGARDSVRQHRTHDAAERERVRVGDYWQESLGRVEVETPDPAMNLMVNRWLPYQTLACRIWGRSALYQSSGAFGFRDQLQDVLAFLGRSPDMARAQILAAASHQFVEGDVLHWWHPPGDSGVRTRCSDDLLWLPFASALYVRATGDKAILDEPVPFLEGRPLEDDELERYTKYPRSTVSASLLEHCLRALSKGMTEGPTGLPLIGTGDWNDALDRVGVGGKGESVWLGWFILAVLSDFVPMLRTVGDQATSDYLSGRAERLRSTLEKATWDGAWYQRATYDDGTPIGSDANLEGRIDSLTQSWAVLSGAADPVRAETAMASVWRELVDEDHRLVRLLTPPFDRTERTPGYIKAYPPGIRENGGQYSHAAAWVAWAFAELGDGERAARVFSLLNPIHHGDDPVAQARYRVEPYVMAGDVYGADPHIGRGGWSWYTGSAGWMLRVATEAILGLRPSGGGIELDPCIPPDWPGFRATIRRGSATYRIAVENPDGVTRGVVEVQLDGSPLPGKHLALLDDGTEHSVTVRLGTRIGTLQQE